MNESEKAANEHCKETGRGRLGYFAFLAGVAWQSKQSEGVAQKLCEIYFNIAASAIGEDEVRKRRDALLPEPYKNEKGES